MESVSGVLARLMRELGLARDLEGWRAVEEWPRLVGPRVARHTRAVGFRDGALQVEVDGSAWMQELSFLKRELLTNIHRQPGTDLVRDIRFIIARGGSPR